MIERLMREMAGAFQGSDQGFGSFGIKGEGTLPSWFAVTDLAVASIGIAGLALARLAGPASPRPVSVDRGLASLWFGMTLRPSGWELPSPWDPIAGDYRSRDGWIRLHTNAPHHRAAALTVLGVGVDREAVAQAVSSWDAVDLETEIVKAGGCAAEMRSLTDWADHPQGRAVAAEPLIHWREQPGPATRFQPATSDRPLAGLRVLDLTRVLAGPVGGRFLAAYGADVLRIDPPDWDEPGVVPEVTLGKRCAGLELRRPDDRNVFEILLSQADILLHGYRPGALEGLGYGEAMIRRINPGLIDVSLDAYGWTGPWAGRRGFDSLLQMSSGIAAHGMAMQGADRPVPLPVQALDHATGYLMAAAVLHALNLGGRSGRAQSARLSLARTAHLLTACRTDEPNAMRVETEADWAPDVEDTEWGPARRIRFPLEIDGIEARWERPASRLRTALPKWPRYPN